MVPGHLGIGFIFLCVLLTGQTSIATTCYKSPGSMHPYFKGVEKTCNSPFCVTVFHGNGGISRGCFRRDQPPAPCFMVRGDLFCMCKGDLCNDVRREVTLMRVNSGERIGVAADVLGGTLLMNLLTHIGYAYYF